MIEGLCLLLAFQIVGSFLEQLLDLPLPGAVLGMFFLLCAMIVSDRIAAIVRPFSLALIAFLGLMFVPAGVGVIQHAERIEHEAAAIIVSLVLSTLLTIAVTAFAIRWTSRYLEKRGEKP